MGYKVNSELHIVNASDKSGVLVYVCFSAQVLHVQYSLLYALEKLKISNKISKDEVISWLHALEKKEQVKFWETLIANYIVVPSEFS
jgi:hypothetical protein